MSIFKIRINRTNQNFES